LIYGTKHDLAVKIAVKGGQKMDELLDNEMLQEEWAAIQSSVLLLAETSRGGAAADDVAPTLANTFSLAAGALGDEAPGIIAELSEAQQESLCEYETEARVLVSSIVRLVDGSQAEKALVTILQKSTIGKIRGGLDGNVVVIYDLKSSGEHVKRPDIYPPPLRRGHAEKMVRVALRSRLSPDAGEDEALSILGGDVLIFFDGARPSFQDALQGGIKGVARETRTLNLVYSEDPLIKKRISSSQTGKTTREGT